MVSDWEVLYPALIIAAITGLIIWLIIYLKNKKK